MPDKENENKLMAMLERRGIVRRAGSEEEPSDSDSTPSKETPRSDVDLSTMFGTSAGSAASDSVRVTPASRQPVPGISTPILSGEQPQNTAREQPQQVESVVVELSSISLSEDEDEDDDAILERILEEAAAEQLIPDDEAEADAVARADTQTETETVEETEDYSFEESTGDELTIAIPEEFEETTIENSFPGGFETFSSDISQAEASVSAPAEVAEIVEVSAERASPPTYQQQPSADSYTDKFIDIDDLYEVLALKSKRTETIYLVEEYLKSLPDSLPDESKRDIVGKIVAASGFDYDLLMGDGVLRVKMLKDYAERFASRTDDYVATRQAELDELDQQITRVRKLIENRRELHKKQFFAIEAEAQRLKEILEFLAG